MLKRVFNGINYAILETTPTTQAQRNQYNEVSAKVQKLKDMVEELNRLHTGNEPMFVKNLEDYFYGKLKVLRMQQIMKKMKLSRDLLMVGEQTIKQSPID